MQAKGRRRGEGDGLTTADLVVLSLLRERAMHGYDLIREYARQEVVDWASVSKAQVYYALQKLARLALIAPLEDGGRDRTVFATTDAGVEVLAEALSDGRWAEARVAQPFTTWLGLSIHLPPLVRHRTLVLRRAFLVSELERERRSLAYIETLEGDRARAGSDIVRLVIAQLEAERVWLETLGA